MELVKLLPVHRYSVVFYSYSGPSGILGSRGKQNTAQASARGVRIVALPLVLMNRHNKTEFAVFLYCSFSVFLKDRFSRFSFITFNPSF